MKITQVIPGLGIHSGGPSRSLVSMTEGLRMIGVDTIIVANDDATNPMVTSAPWIHAVAYRHNALGYNPRFRKALDVVESDLFHVHSIYSYSTTIAMRVAEQRGLPFIVSPRGSLLESALSSSSKKLKQVFNKWVLFPDMKKAAAIHATSEEEVSDLLKLGINRPVILIPNSIQLPAAPLRHPRQARFRVGVCGRINPIKNIDGVLRAWAKAGMGGRDAELVIIGGTAMEKEIAYLDQLHKLERELGIGNIVWAGPTYGKEKQELFETFSVLLLASHSENFGMVVPEALSMGIPVIASSGTPWRVLEQTNSGWWIDNSDDSISGTILSVYKIFQDSSNELEVMGQSGIRLVKDTFSQESVASKWKEVYDWILAGSPKPDFVTD